MNVRKGGWWKLALPLVLVGALIAAAAGVISVLDRPDRVGGTGEVIRNVDGDDVTDGGFTSTVVSPELDPADQAAADAGLAAVEAYLDAAWRNPAASGDIFGYDYTTWLDVAAHPDLDRSLFDDGPAAVGLDTYNSDLARYVANRHADLRSALWVLTSTADSGDWLAHRTDPAFALGPVNAFSYVATDEFVGENDTIEPIIDRAPDGTLLRIRWPFTAGVTVKMTVDGVDTIGTYSMVATLELWPVDGDEANLAVGSIASVTAHVNGLSTTYTPVADLGVGATPGRPGEVGQIIVD